MVIVEKAVLVDSGEHTLVSEEPRNGRRHKLKVNLLTYQQNSFKGQQLMQRETLGMCRLISWSLFRWTERQHSLLFCLIQTADEAEQKCNYFLFECLLCACLSKMAKTQGSICNILNSKCNFPVLTTCRPLTGPSCCWQIQDTSGWHTSFCLLKHGNPLIVHVVRKDGTETM